MQLSNVFIPFRAWWSTPFCKWQGSLAALEPIPLAAATARALIERRKIDPTAIDGLTLGTTVPSHHAFYGAPWLAGLAGLEHATGPTIAQACATGARCLEHAASEVALGASEAMLVITADRTSNGPHLYYPKPSGMGGTGAAENWVVDNFGHDPFAGNSMLETAENVARHLGISRAEQEAAALLRYEQYQSALKNERAFQAAYFMPVELKDGRGQVRASVSADEGVFPTTAAGLAKLKPVLEGGSVTFGTQTYPADGNAGLLVCSKDRARALSSDPSIEVAVVAFGQARVRKGYMPLANAPAVRQALHKAGITPRELKAITTHTPFAVNDVALSRELELPIERMNRFGCSLIWGHPQAPTGLRSIVELVEELAQSGGGYGLFTGCAAGDSAMAAVLRVSVS